MSRNRDQYWFQIYVNKLVLTEPRIAFACLVVGPQREGPRIQVGVAEEAMAVVPDKERDGNLLSYKDEDGVTTTGVMYDAIVLQLGSFFRYSLYRPANMPLVKGKRKEMIYVELFPTVLVCCSCSTNRHYLLIAVYTNIDCFCLTR